MSRNSDFEKFFRQNYDNLYYYALQMVGDGETCRDIVGEALTKAWENFDEQEMDKLKNFAYSMVHNKCVDQVRHEMVKARYADFYRHMFSEQDSGYSYEETDRQISLIYEMIGRFTPKTRYILEQCYFHERRYKDVAEEMGVSTNTVKKHIVNALKAFREELMTNGK